MSEQSYVITKDDWNISPMPEKTASFWFVKHFSKEQLQTLKLGHLPRGMEDRWFSYYERGKLYIHRSWSGNCIYIIKFHPLWNFHKVIVNRDETQYSETSIKEDRTELVSLLINLN